MERSSSMSEERNILDRLSFAREHLADHQAELKDALDAAIPDDVRKRMAEIEAELMPGLNLIAATCSELEAEARGQVLSEARSIKGEKLEAVYCEGRVGWDTKGLDKAIKLIPALAEYRKTGDPYVTIRAIREVGK
jgi:hypothetical protein